MSTLLVKFNLTCMLKHIRICIYVDNKVQHMEKFHIL